MPLRFAAQLNTKVGRLVASQSHVKLSALCREGSPRREANNNTKQLNKGERLTFGAMAHR